ncbi:MAG: hypothetical protein KAU21_04985 [Gammaproteobacteria bacterium]|nr:hypothetical protein [Gammaproteobacteria bacterium]
MNSEDREVITFDNLVRPTEVTGQYAPVKAVDPVKEPFVNGNAAGLIPQIANREELGKMASLSGARLKKLFS